jgi:hypothetical protein
MDSSKLNTKCLFVCLRHHRQWFHYLCVYLSLCTSSLSFTNPSYLICFIYSLASHHLLSICLSIHPPTYLLIHLSIHPSIYPSIHPSTYHHLLSIYLPIIYLSFYLSFIYNFLSTCTPYLLGIQPMYLSIHTLFFIIYLSSFYWTRTNRNISCWLLCS